MLLIPVEGFKNNCKGDNVLDSEISVSRARSAAIFARLRLLLPVLRPETSGFLRRGLGRKGRKVENASLRKILRTPKYIAHERPTKGENFKLGHVRHQAIGRVGLLLPLLE